MPSQQFERRSLELTPEQWANLEALAEAIGSIAPTGPNAGMTSWRSLIKQLANDQLQISLQPVDAKTAQQYLADLANI